MKFRARFEVEVEIEVPEIAITRVLENHDEEGKPVPLGSGNGWQDYLYKLSDEGEVVEMLARNMGLYQRPLATLDGWADLKGVESSGKIVSEEMISCERVVAPQEPA